MSELKSCPWCGGTEFSYDDHQCSRDSWTSDIVCENNECINFGVGDSQGEARFNAIEAWNTRAPPAPMVLRIKTHSMMSLMGHADRPSSPKYVSVADLEALGWTVVHEERP